MLGLIALVLIVLWLFGFLAFHLSASLIHYCSPWAGASDFALRERRYQNGIGWPLGVRVVECQQCVGRTRFLC